MITASARERWRNRNCLSSREVKSAGAEFGVVIFPSTVIANVALTNGRSEPDWRLAERRLRRVLLFETLAASRADLLRLRDFMLGRCDFAFHFAEFHALGDAAWSIKEVNDAARRGGD